jgi:hypothetical protein
VRPGNAEGKPDRGFDYRPCRKVPDNSIKVGPSGSSSDISGFRHEECRAGKFRKLLFLIDREHSTENILHECLTTFG